ncbi:MAG: cell envelope biogenesis protein OmpA [Treponema sp.]|nr:MAG: cell envelope biogenesis protein OmpA [Treponema sp.]
MNIFRFKFIVSSGICKSPVLFTSTSKEAHFILLFGTFWKKLQRAFDFYKFFSIIFFLSIFGCVSSLNAEDRKGEDAGQDISQTNQIEKKLETDETIKLDSKKVVPASNDEADFTVDYDERISIKERSDYRTYVNGKYSGLTYREAEIYLLQTNSGGTFFYDGETFVIQDTRKNMLSTIRKLDTVYPVQFEYAPESDYAFDNPYHPQFFHYDNGFPLLRNFPFIPNIKFTDLHIGKKWEGKSTVVVRPKRDMPYAKIPVYAEYEYKGKTTYLGMPVHKVVARYALRNTSNGSDPSIVRTSGTRSADIFLNPDTQAPVFIRERTNEIFEYQDGTKIENKGNLLHFYKYEKNTVYKDRILLPGDIKKGNPNNIGKIDKIKKEITDKISKNKNYTVKKTKRGVQINLKNLKFQPDSSVLLSTEKIKLEEIAKILKAYPDAKFFVEGHTADVGNPEGQKKLSEQRALTIVNELVNRGIDSSQFMYSGAGATKPIAKNDNDVNRAKNRRVEITIMQ